MLVPRYLREETLMVYFPNRLVTYGGGGHIYHAQPEK